MNTTYTTYNAKVYLRYIHEIDLVTILTQIQLAIELQQRAKKGEGKKLITRLYIIYTVEIKLEIKACGRLYMSLDMVLSRDEDN